MPKFRAALSDDEAFDAASRVLRAADPASPGAVTQTAFDASRSACADLTSATALTRRFGLSWDQFKRVALASPADRPRLLGVLNRATAQPVTEAEIRAGLQLVARRLNTTELSGTGYDSEVRAMHREQAKAWKHGRPDAVPPSFNQVVRTLPWSEALALAGLEQATEPRQRQSVPRAELAEAFIDAFDCVPSQAMVERWARESNVSLGRPDRPWAEVVADLAERRSRAGKGMPSPCARGTNTDPARGAPAAPGSATRRRVSTITRIPQV